MSLSLVKYEESLHRELVAPWFEAKGDGPAVNWLPAGSTYLVKDEEHGLTAVGSLLLTNSKLCFMEHLTTDQGQRQITQSRALRFIVLALEQIAKTLNYDVILGLVPEDHFALAEFYKRQGAFLGSKLMRVTYKPLK